MVHGAHCDICGDTAKQSHIKQNVQNDDISFAALLALVPAMALTLFSLMGLI